MNILINTPDLQLPGGVANYYATIRKHFSANVEYFTVGRRNDEKGIVRSVTRIISDYLRFAYKLLFGGYDLVHLNPSLSSKSFVRDALFIIIAKVFRKKVLVFFRGWDVEFEKELLVKPSMWLKNAYLRVDGIIVLAAEFEDKLQLMGYGDRVFLETTVVDEGVFGKPVSTKINIESGSISLLFLSRIEKNKGIYESIDALGHIIQKYPNISLTIAGNGSELEHAKTYVNDRNIHNIKFVGHVIGEEKDKIFNEADIFLFPTYHGEGMPNAVLEAMAYGLPVITTPVGGLNDFFENGKMGYLLRGKGITEITNCIEKLVLDPECRINISKYNRSYAEKKFKASNVVQRIEKIYAELSRRP